MKILLKRDGVNPNRPDKRDRTPLYRAAMERHEGVVKILLGWDGINHNSLDKHGQTPLHIAAIEVHDGAVKMLLRWSDANPDKHHFRRLLCGGTRE